MNISDSQEIWHIDAGGQVYEARFEEMAQWIYEGSLLPQDLVKRGNLRWIEARKVPSLMRFFNAKERGESAPVFASVTDAQGTPKNSSFPPSQNPFPTNNQQAAVNHYQTAQNTFEPPTEMNFQAPVTSWQPQFSPPSNESAAHQFNVMPSADFCSLHADAPTAYLCGTCGNGFCPVCPKSYGGTVKICPFCGAMCRSVKEVREKTQEAMSFDRAVTQGFGFEDFFAALAYPFKFKASLFFGAIMFMLFTLGQSATALGGFMLVAAAILCWMFANMLSFGVLANTVENFAQGKITRNFMPDFDDFSLWDDVVHPFFLCVATYLVSFGLLFIFIAGLVYFTWTTFNGKPPVTMEDRINVAQRDLERRKSGEYTFNEDGTIKGGPGRVEEQDIEEIQKLIKEQKQKELESVVGKTPQQEAQDQKEMWTNFVGLGIPAVLFAFLLLTYGLLYYPAACLVAGYTRSFTATMKPSVGWETIKILGWDYVKILVMCFIISAAMFFIGLILGIVFYAFNMPGVGNLPAKAVGALFGFYFSVVFAVMLGFALYKNADKLNLFKG